MTMVGQHGARTHEQDKEGRRPLLAACNSRHTEVVSNFLKCGADIQNKNDSSPLLTASFNGHIEVVSMLLERGANINLQVNDGRSPLWAASYKGHSEVVSMLLECGADINLQDNDGESPLFAASYNGHSNVVAMLLERGADINLPVNYGRSPLWAASYNGHSEVIYMLLERSADINLKDKDGSSPLLAASYNGHSEVIPMLLERGADINLQVHDGRSPLWIASYNGHSEVISMLLERGADINLQDNDGESPLFAASNNGISKVVSMLLEFGADTNLQVNDGRSPLWVACYNGHLDIVSMLLERGADINIQDNNGESPLWAASYKGHSKVVSILLERGADSILQINDGESPLFAASYNGHSNVVAMLLERSADINLQDNAGESPLFAVSKNGISNVVYMLLEFGADTNLQVNDGRSPLWVASNNGHLDIVSMLLERGADINIQDNNGESPLWTASYNGHSKVVSVLLERGADINLQINDAISPLWAASYNGHSEVVAMLLEHGADINLNDNDGCSPLWSASSNGHLEIASMLLERGADINLQDNDGEFPLFAASHNGHFKVVSMLIERGADIKLQVNDGRSPLWEASYNGHLDVVSMLLERGADINHQVNDGRSPLWAASSNGHLDVVSMLLERGADINLQDNDGEFPLFAASYNGHFKVVSMLLERGADINLKDNDGSTSLWEASYNGHSEVVSMLIERGADINLQDNDGESPLWAASSNGQTEVVFLLLERGADIHLKDMNGSTPLWTASHRGLSEIVSMLLKRGADKNLLDNDGKAHRGAETCQQVKFGSSFVLTASDNVHAEVETMQLKCGTDVHLRDEFDKSPLYTEIYSGRTIVCRLLNHGAENNLHDNNMASLTDYSKKDEVKEEASSLVQHGADAIQPEYKGQINCTPDSSLSELPYTSSVAVATISAIRDSNKHLGRKENESVECMQRISEECSAMKAVDINSQSCASSYQCSLCTSISSDNSRDSSDFEEDLNLLILTPDQTVKHPEDISGKSTSNPIMCPNWQNSGYFEYEGGTLRSEHSDVELQIPLGAIKHDATVKIMSGVNVDFNDLYARLRGELQKEEIILSPLVEYYVEDNFKFETCVTILLPHLLPVDFIDSDVRVYHVTRNANNAILLSEVPKQTRPSAASALAQTCVSDASDFICSFCVEADFISVQTNHFSAVFCTYCNKNKQVKRHPKLFIRSHGALTDYEDCQHVDIDVLIWDKRIHIKDFMMQEYGIDIMKFKDSVPIGTSSNTKENLQLRINTSRHHKEMKHRQDLQGKVYHAEEMTYNLMGKFGCNKCIQKLRYDLMRHHWGLELPSNFRKLREIEVNFTVSALPVKTGEDETSVNIRVQKESPQTVLYSEPPAAADLQSCAEGTSGSGASQSVSTSLQRTSSGDGRALQRIQGDQRPIACPDYGTGASGAERNFTVQNNFFQVSMPSLTAHCQQLALTSLQQEGEDETTYKYVHKSIILTTARKLGPDGSQTFFLDLGLSKEQCDELFRQCKRDDKSIRDTNFLYLYKWCQSLDEAQNKNAVNTLKRCLRRIGRMDIVEKIDALQKDEIN